MAVTNHHATGMHGIAVIAIDNGESKRVKLKLPYSILFTMISDGYRVFDTV